MLRFDSAARHNVGSCASKLPVPGFDRPFLLQRQGCAKEMPAIVQFWDLSVRHSGWQDGAGPKQDRRRYASSDGPPWNDLFIAPPQSRTRRLDASANGSTPPHPCPSDL